MLLLSARHSEFALSSDDSFNAVGLCISLYKSLHKGAQNHLLRHRFPRMDAFEDMFGDRYAPNKPYALRVMAILDGRSPSEPLNDWYARIVSLSQSKATHGMRSTNQDLAGCFMAACVTFGTTPSSFQRLLGHYHH